MRCQARWHFNFNDSIIADRTGEQQPTTNQFGQNFVTAKPGDEHGLANDRETRDTKDKDFNMASANIWSSYNVIAHVYFVESIGRAALGKTNTSRLGVYPIKIFIVRQVLSTQNRFSVQFYHDNDKDNRISIVFALSGGSSSSFSARKLATRHRTASKNRIIILLTFGNNGNFVFRRPFKIHIS